jgi:uncharacterized membrane protein (DUF106 family)
MTSEIVVTLISCSGGIIVGIVSVFVSKSIIAYRIEQLEEKVKKHNNLVERVYRLEYNDKAQWIKINETKGTIKEIREEMRK